MGRSKYKLLRYGSSKYRLPKELSVNIHKGKLYVRNLDNTNDIELSTPDISEHIEIVDHDPHDLQSYQVDLDNVVNIKQASKKDFIKHKYDYNNPHKVTKEQIGLGKIKNIKGVSKEFFLKELLLYKQEMEYKQGLLFKILNKFGDEYVKKFTLSFILKPATVEAYVFYNGIWNKGVTHKLYLGVYDYKIVNRGKIEKEGYILIKKDTVIKFESKTRLLKFNIDDPDVFVNLKKDAFTWLKNTEFNLDKDKDYPWYINAEGYYKIENNVYLDEDKTIDITLIPKKYLLEFSVFPYDADVEIEIESGVWVNKKKEYLLPGTYNYKVYKDRYVTITGTVELEKKDQLIEVLLQKEIYNIKIKSNVEDISTEVFYNNKWNFGFNFYLPYNKYFIRATHDLYEKSIVGFIADKDKTINIEMVKKKYTLIVYTDPFDADVCVNLGGNEWVKSSTIKLTSGIYRVVVNHAGYNSEDILIEIKNEDKIVNLKLKRIISKLSIKTIPQDGVKCEVWFEDKWLDTKTNYIPSGNYQCRISKDHYKTIFTNVIFNPLYPIMDTVIMEPMMYNINFNCFPINSIVKIDNHIGSKYSFTGNIENMQLPHGKYNYTVECNGYKTYTDVLDVNSNLDHVVMLEEKKHKLTLTINNSSDISDCNILFNKTTEVFVFNYPEVNEFDTDLYSFSISKPGYEDKHFNLYIDKDTKFDVIMNQLRYYITFKIIGSRDPDTYKLFIKKKGEEKYLQYIDEYITLYNGDYEYKITADNYKDIIGEFTINNNDVIKEIEFFPKISKIDIKVKNLNNYKIRSFLNDKEVNLKYPIYLNNMDELEYIVSKEGYVSYKNKITISKNFTDTVDLLPEMYKLNCIIYPPNKGYYVMFTDGNKKYTTPDSSYTLSIPKGIYTFYIFHPDKENSLYSGSFTVDLDNMDFILELPETEMTIKLYNPFENSRIQLFLNGKWEDVEAEKDIKLPINQYEYRIISNE